MKSILTLAKLSLLFTGLAVVSCGGGGGSGGGGATISATTSTVAVSTAFGSPADGTSSVTITVTVLTNGGSPLKGRTVTIQTDGTGDVLVQPVGKTAADGIAVGTLTTTVPGLKTVTVVVDPGPNEVVLAARPTVEFIEVLPGSRYVRTSGSDANGGTSPVDAWRTLSFAATQVQPGDTVHVGAGTYSESVVLTISGTSTDPIHFLADNTGLATGDAGSVVVDAFGGTFALRLDGIQHVVVRGFTLTGAIAGGANGGGVWSDSPLTSDVALVGNTIFGNDRGITLRNGRDFHLEGNRISNNLGTSVDGVELDTLDGVTLLNNLIYNNGRYGVLIQDQVTNLSIDLNTFYGNGSDQIHELGSGSTGLIENTVITNGFADGIDLIGGSGIAESFNLVWGNAGEDLSSGRSLSITSISADPLFVDPDGPDDLLGGAEGADDLFVFQGGSPALDAGSAMATEKILLFGGPLSGLTSRSDGILDGAEGDGEMANLGFHYAAVFDAQPWLYGGDARVFYARANEVQLLGRSWDDASDTWTADARTTPTNSTAKWVVSRVCPLSKPEELLAVLTDNGTSTNLFVRRWDGRQWSANAFPSNQSGIASVDSDQRGFDLAYELVSGEALLVRTDGTANPVFRTMQDGVWSSDAPVYASATGGKILWVQLLSRTGTDEVGLVTLDDQENLCAAYWDGSDWDVSTPVLIDDRITTTTASKAFDAAFESLSGDLIVAWGHTVLIEETRYAIRSNATGNWSVEQVTSTDSVGRVVRLASDPTSDRILGAVAEGDLDDDTTGMIWDGDAWVHIAELDPTGGFDQRDLAVGWLGTTGQAVMIWRDADGAGTLDWARWDTGGWKVQQDAILPGVGDTALAKLIDVPGEDRLMALLADDAGELFALTYDGAQWTVSNGGASLGSGITTNGTTVPFSLDFKRP